MKVKLGEIRPILEVLPTVLEKELPFKAAYWLGRAAKQLHSEYAPFETAHRKLIEQHCQRDDQGEPVVKDNEYQMKDRAEFDQLYFDLAETEIEITYEPMTIDELRGVSAKDPDGIVKSIRGIDLLGLGCLIKDDGGSSTES